MKNVILIYFVHDIKNATHDSPMLGCGPGPGYPGVMALMRPRVRLSSPAAPAGARGV